MKYLNILCSDDMIAKIDKLRKEMGNCSRTCIGRMAVQYYLDHMVITVKNEKAAEF